VGGAKSLIPKKATTNWKAVHGIVMSGCTLETLKSCTPEVPPDTASVLQSIYQPQDLLCCGEEMHSARTQSLSDWLAGGLSGLRLIVPNPMTKAMGVNQQGRASARCLDNTGPRKFLVVEFDFALGKSAECDEIITALEKTGRTTADMNAALHVRLQEYLPLGMVVYSGGKSLHVEVGRFFQDVQAETDRYHLVESEYECRGKSPVNLIP
jgi:hypothetical protein